MKKRSLNLLIFLLMCSLAYGQQVRCATDIKIENNRILHSKVNAKIEQYRNSNLRQSNEVIRIPVVVHVIHNNRVGTIGGAGNSNISEEQIVSQIEVLNEDYRKKPGTPGYSDNLLAADMEIEFFLANIDPKGFPSTGINRVYSSRRNFSVYSDLEMLSDLAYWDSNKYLNIWVTSLSGGILGYAEFPIGNFDGLEATEINERIDGIFIDHTSFGRQTGTAIGGRYDKGRTVTHEVGHWLGLIHTWGDEYCGDDFCNDTPRIESANNQMGCDPIYSRCRLSSVENMIENYMDYSDDACMNLFTHDQKSRVRAILEISTRRKNLLNNLDFFKPIEEDILVKVLGNPVEGDFFNLNIFVNQPKNYTVQIYDNLGRIVFEEEYKNSSNRNIQIPKNSLGKSLNHLKVRTAQSIITHKLVSF